MEKTPKRTKKVINRREAVKRREREVKTLEAESENQDSGNQESGEAGEQEKRETGEQEAGE